LGYLLHKHPEKAYRRYCAPVNGVEDLKLAPFHLLASEGLVHTDKDHLWHMQTLARLSQAAPHILQATSYELVTLNDEVSCQQAIMWWHDLTQKGGEGMVVKPLTFVGQGQRGLIQPAIKCRGPEYLRIIYGPEIDYDALGQNMTL
jgi:protein phosphatase